MMKPCIYNFSDSILEILELRKSTVQIYLISFAFFVIITIDNFECRKVEHKPELFEKKC